MQKCKFNRVVEEEYNASAFVTKKHKKHYFDIEASLNLVIFAGASENEGVSIWSRNSKMEIVRVSRDLPYSEVSISDSGLMDCPLTWLMQHVKDCQVEFGIDRADKLCRTPRRNKDTEEALYFCNAFLKWATNVSDYLKNDYFERAIPREVTNENYQRNLPSPELDNLRLLHEKVFSPIIPLFEVVNGGPSAPDELAISPTLFVCIPYDKEVSSSPLLSARDKNALLMYQLQTLKEALQNVNEMFTSDNSYFSAKETSMVLILSHITQFCCSYNESMQFIEDMIYSQLIKAVGKGKIRISIHIILFLSKHST
jgi:hypothetical protein